MWVRSQDMNEFGTHSILSYSYQVWGNLAGRKLPSTNTMREGGVGTMGRMHCQQLGKRSTQY